MEDLFNMFDTLISGFKEILNFFGTIINGILDGIIGAYNFAIKLGQSFGSYISVLPNEISTLLLISLSLLVILLVYRFVR